MRLEIVARGRYLYEMNPVDNTAVPYNLLGSNSNISLNSKDFKRQANKFNSNQFPIH